MTDTLNPTFDERRISWAAVWAGVFAALAVQILLIMLGIGIGAISIDLPSVRSIPGLRWAAFGWWAFGGVIAAFVGGWLAGSLAGSATDRTMWAGSGALHGFLAWAVATVIVVGAAGMAAGTTATVVGSLAGPTIATRADLQQAATDIAGTRQRETTGAPAASETTVPSGRPTACRAGHVRQRHAGKLHRAASRRDRRLAQRTNGPRNASAEPDYLTCLLTSPWSLDRSTSCSGEIDWQKLCRWSPDVKCRASLGNPQPT